MNRKTRRLRLIIIILLPLIAWLVLIYKYPAIRSMLRSLDNSISIKLNPASGPTLLSEISNTKENYGGEIDRVAELLKLPAPYFKALVIIECSGEKPAPHRFEQHVYKRLKELKSGKTSEYKNIKSADLENTDDDTLKSMASS
ncbi:MAG: hypothetical protein JW874_05910 [Spirochaetales bacterium]|nr:hypothetical protein [Spirochaetales bacterium]